MAHSKAFGFFDRLSQDSSPLLPLHNKKRRDSNEYNLQELSPSTEAALISEGSSDRERLAMRSPSPMGPWEEEQASSNGSTSKLKKPNYLFKGPPAPIASSVMRSSSGSPTSSRERRRKNAPAGPGRTMFGSVFFDSASSPRQASSRVSEYSVWRVLQRREKAISQDLQHLLDMQASGLVAGRQATNPSSTASSDTDAFSDDGSTTPTATFYSTVTSRSRMLASLDNPARANSRGDVIPVRQPKASRPRGLRAARDGLRKSMSALADLKIEEDSQIGSALLERKQALSHLQRLSAKRESISADLRILSDESEEPLAKELGDLGRQDAELDLEIRELEERLVGMRNRQRWLKRKMEDVRNRREAGLSSYKNSLKGLNSEVDVVLHRPPVDPLDADVLLSDNNGREDPESDMPPNFTSGEDFLQLIPERRTVDMALEWWEGEIALLENRKKQVDRDRIALEAGLELWQECTALVGEFETNLKRLMGGGDAQGEGKGKGKGKEKLPSPEEAVQGQLENMARVVMQLEDYTKQAETNGWTLLICAIGAELEAFKEAQVLLGGNLGNIHHPTRQGPFILKESERTQPDLVDATDSKEDDQASESDNEVPPDLLVSHVDHEADSVTSGQARSRSRDGAESDSDVPPPEFLAEHDPEPDTEPGSGPGSSQGVDSNGSANRA